MNRVVFLLSATLVIGCGTTAPPRGASPPPQVSPSADPTVLAAAGSSALASTSSHGATLVDLSGQWALDPMKSYDPLIPNSDDAAKRRRGRGGRGRGAGAIGRGRRALSGGFAGAAGAGRQGVPNRGVSDDSESESGVNLMDATILGAQRLSITQRDRFAVIEREDQTLVEKAQFWDEGQLVVLRKLPKTVARERFTLSPDGNELHVTVDVVLPGREPVTFVRRFRNKENLPSDSGQ